MHPPCPWKTSPTRAFERESWTRLVAVARGFSVSLVTLRCTWGGQLRWSGDTGCRCSMGWPLESWVFHIKTQTAIGCHFGLKCAWVCLGLLVYLWPRGVAGVGVAAIVGLAVRLRLRICACGRTDGHLGECDCASGLWMWAWLRFGSFRALEVAGGRPVNVVSSRFGGRVVLANALRQSDPPNPLPPPQSCLEQCLQCRRPPPPPGRSKRPV